MTSGMKERFTTIVPSLIFSVKDTLVEFESNLNSSSKNWTLHQMSESIMVVYHNHNYKTRGYRYIFGPYTSLSLTFLHVFCYIFSAHAGWDTAATHRVVRGGVDAT